MDKNLKALHNVCAIFGICRQTPTFCGHNGERFILIYIAVLILIEIMNCVWGITTSTITNEFIISWAVATIVFISQVCTHIIIMCETLSKNQEHKDFLNMLDKIDVDFKILLKMNVNKTRIINRFRKNFIVLNVISKSCLLLFALIFYIFSDTGYFWWALISILAMRFRFLQLIVYVEILKYYVQGLNLKLRQVVSLKMEEQKQLLDIDYKPLESLEVIKNIKHIYAAIYEASTLMNEFAQSSLFAASASNFLDFTCHIYWTLLVMDNLLSIYNVFASTTTILPLGLFIYKFCASCQVIKEEGHQTSLLLSRLISCNIGPRAHSRYKNLIHDFSLQIMHQRIVFTEKRFFNFDLNCIFTICALIVTHLIILIQFTKNDGSHYMNDSSLTTN
ncbi:putative gustatory receptor 39b [Cochliomyia hominivorax]